MFLSLDLLRRRGWIAALLALLAVAASLAWSLFLATPRFTSETSLIIMQKGAALQDYNTLLLNQTLTQTYAEIARGHAVLQQVIQDLDLDHNHAEGHASHPTLTPAELSRRVSVTAIKGTQIIRLRVSDTDPASAQRLAAETAAAFTARVRALMKVDNVQVIDPASLPSSHDYPRPILNALLAAVLGLAFGLALIFLLAHLDNTLRTTDDVAKHFGLPVLGIIPTITSTDAIMVVSKQPRSTAAEAFRMLATNLRFVGLDRPLKTILVTSSVPGEGKSFTALNLATALAQTGRKVLLIDADLRQPAIHRYGGLWNEGLGLTVALTSQEEGMRDVFAQPTEVENLHILTSGPIPPNPVELLGSSRMATLIERLEAQYDLLIIDGPPVLVAADASVLSTYADGCLLVVRSGLTKTPLATRGLETLRQVKAKTLGAVLDAVGGAEKGYRHYDRYHYYHYYEARAGRHRKGQGSDRVEGSGSGAAAPPPRGP